MAPMASLAEAAKGITKAQKAAFEARLKRAIESLAEVENKLVLVIDVPQTDIIKEVLAEFSNHHAPCFQ